MAMKWYSQTKHQYILTTVDFLSVASLCNLIMDWLLKHEGRTSTEWWIIWDKVNSDVKLTDKQQYGSEMWNSRNLLSCKEAK